MDTTTPPTSPDATTDPVTTGVLPWLDACADQLVGLVDGLDDDALRGTVLPSGWTPLGLLGHVRDSTVFWLHHVLLGHPVAMDDGDDVWDDDPDAPAAEVVAGYLAAHRRAVDGVRALAAADPPAWWPEGAWGGYRQHTVLGVLLHLLADNTAHAGHLAVVRELTDGGTWDHATGVVRVPVR
jgi:hypothetical protein